MKNIILLLTFIFAQFAFGSYSVPDKSITPRKLAPANIVTSSVNPFWTYAGSTTPSEVTDVNVTITTSGRPVMVRIEPGVLTGNGAFLQCRASSAKTDIGCNFYIYRDGSSIAAFNITSNGASSNLLIAVPPGVVSFIDQPTAASHTYKLYAAPVSGAAGYNVDTQMISMTAMEI